MAEGAGFEPANPFGQPDFKSGGVPDSPTPPSNVLSLHLPSVPVKGIPAEILQHLSLFKIPVPNFLLQGSDVAKIKFRPKEVVKMERCVFCRIAAKELESRIAYEDEEAVAFYDINPQAPVHLLIVPRRHIATLNEASPDDRNLLGKLLLVAQRLAKQLNIADGGYRVVLNTNRGAGQSVFHLHLHLLGGRAFGWPPG